MLLVPKLAMYRPSLVSQAAIRVHRVRSATWCVDWTNSCARTRAVGCQSMRRQEVCDRLRARVGAWGCAAC